MEVQNAALGTATRTASRDPYTRESQTAPLRFFVIDALPLICKLEVPHPVATAAAVTATAVVTAAVVGSIVHSVPPSCSTVVVNGLAYQQCGSTWYQPQFSGTTTTYVVVNPPR
jgi:hypothetical protein